jgi:hypothetical protein
MKGVALPSYLHGVVDACLRPDTLSDNIEAKRRY